MAFKFLVSSEDMRFSTFFHYYKIEGFYAKTEIITNIHDIHDFFFKFQIDLKKII